MTVSDDKLDRMRAIRDEAAVDSRAKTPRRIAASVL